jgi:hypothetical protein
MADDWFEIGKRPETTLDEFLQALKQSRPNSFDDPETFVSHFAVTGRFKDIKQFLTDPKYKKYAVAAKTEWDCYITGLRLRQHEEQKYEALPEVLKAIQNTLYGIWWIARISYPHESPHYESNCVITGDGMGLGYFTIDGEPSQFNDDTEITVVKIKDETMERCLLRNEVPISGKTTIKELHKALISYKLTINARAKGGR